MAPTGSPLTAPLIDSAQAQAEQGHAGVGGPERGEAAAPSSSFAEIVKPFSVLGWTAFGGPTAHIARYHNSFVENRQWLGDALFAELLALCQMLPGPSSSQMSFSLGILRAGPLGGLLSGLLFLYPGLLLLTLSGLGASQALADPPPWLLSASAGLVAVAVALVAEAAVLLGNKLCKEPATQLICCASAALAFAFPVQWLFPVLILGGGAAMLIQSWWAQRRGMAQSASNPNVSSADADTITHLGLTPLAGVGFLVLWIAIGAGAVVAKHLIEYDTAPWIHWFEAFYLTGSVAYGGGQVMLPFMQHVVVQYDTICPADPHVPCYQVESNSTWVTEREFLTGLGIVQAMPGPLFNFSGYLGAVMGGVKGAIVCWLGLFGPGVLLVYAALPFWSQFRRWAMYKKALPGLNAAAVGLIYATVFQLALNTYKASPFPAASVSVGIAGFACSSALKVPAPLVILLGAVSGSLIWASSLL